MEQFVVLAMAIAVAGAAWGQVPPLTFKGIEFGLTTANDLTQKYPGSKKYDNSTISATANGYLDATCGSLLDSIRNGTDGLRGCRATKETWEKVADLFRIGRTSAGDFWFDIRDDKVEGMRGTFTTISYGAIAGALEEKYGKPAEVKTEEVANKVGGRFQSETRRWKLQDGEIIVTERSGKVDEMSLRMSSRKLLELKAKESAQRAKDAVKSL